MRATRKNRTIAPCVGLLLFSAVVTFPDPSRADDNANLLKEIMTQAERVNGDMSLGADSLHLEEVLSYAQQHNPAIQAARQRVLAAQERPAQVSALEDPVFTYEGFNLPENFDLTRADNNILKLSQKLPFPGKRQLRGEIATHETEIAKEEARMVEATTRAGLKNAYYDLWQVQQNLLLYSHDKELVARFAAIAEQKYAVGLSSQPDVLRAQVELTRLSTRITTETLKVEQMRARLNRFLGRPPEAFLGAPQDAPLPVLTHTLAELMELALQTRPEIAAQAVAIRRHTAALALARKAYYPDFEVYAERFFNTSRKDGVGVIFSATIPLAYREKYDAGVAEATARLSASKADLRAAQDIALAEVKEALARAQTAVALVNLFTQTHLPQAEQALESSRISYQTGKVDFLSLIDSLRAIEQVHIEHIAAATDFEKAYADLERAVGQPLPRQ